MPTGSGPGVPPFKLSLFPIISMNNKEVPLLVLFVLQIQRHIPQTVLQRNAFEANNSGWNIFWSVN
jgi:hypothetical protein